jgi:hypothetical protein
VHLAGGDLGDKPAVPQHDDPVGEPEHLPYVVAGQRDRGALRAQPGDEPFHQGGFTHAERGGGFVEQQDARCPRHGPGDRDHLPLSARQRLHRAGGVRDGNAKLRQEMGRVGMQVDGGEQVPLSLVAEHDVGTDVEVVGERQVLPDDPHAASRGGHRIRGKRLSVQLDGARVGGEVAAERPDQRCLPGAVLPGDGDAFPSPHRQADPVEGGQRPEPHSQPGRRKFRRCRRAGIGGSGHALHCYALGSVNWTIALEW